MLLLLPCSPDALRNPGHDSCKWNLSSYRVNYRPDDFHSAKRTRDEPDRPERLPYFNERVVERFRKMKLGLGLDLQLKQHQQDGVVFILRHICSQSPCGCIVADSMGLGKTIQALAAAFFMFCAFDLRTVIVAPKSLTEQWHGEAVRWFADASWMKVVTYDMAGTCCPQYLYCSIRSIEPRKALSVMWDSV